LPLISAWMKRRLVLLLHNVFKSEQVVCFTLDVLESFGRLDHFAGLEIATFWWDFWSCGVLEVFEDVSSGPDTLDRFANFELKIILIERVRAVGIHTFFLCGLELSLGFLFLLFTLGQEVY
jgi:hypothetical protein